MSSSARYTSRPGFDASVLATYKSSRTVQATAKPSKPSSSSTSATSPPPQVAQSYVSFTDLGFFAPFDLDELVAEIFEQDLESASESDETTSLWCGSASYAPSIVSTAPSSIPSRPRVLRAVRPG
ncbi:hypothetical protein JCM8547_004782 [Rhodosporidiobolus lusitaniae]